MNRTELRELGEKKGFKLCSRIVNAAIKYLICDSEINPSQFIVDVYYSVYPVVKALVLEFKGTIEY